MPRITPKSPETIQAQAAAFAAERISHYSNQEHILNNLGSLAVDTITRRTASAEYHTDEAGTEVRVPEGAEVTVATPSEYTDFLRAVGGSKYESIRGRADMLEAYATFAPTISRLRQELSDPATRKEHPSFMGSGLSSMVFSIADGEKKYAVRVPKGRGVNPSVIDSHFGGAVLGRGIPHLEQIVAGSYEDGVTIAEIMPGKETGDLTVEEINSITDEQLNQLVDTLAAANERGIEIDPKPSNIFYDPESGFGIVDYHSSKKAGKNSASQDLGEVVGWMSGFMESAGFYGKAPNFEMNEADYAHDVAFHKANLGVMERYRKVVEDKLEDDEQGKALVQLDSRIQAIRKLVTEYLDPEWVAKSVAQMEERKRRRAEMAGKRREPAAGISDFV